jgi:CheY-like chemotaxis protein/HPt (histidine-containing phosphotransfer) domain-containing protein
MSGLVEDLILASTLYNTDGQGLMLRSDAINVNTFLQEHADQVRSRLYGSVYLDVEVDPMVPIVVLTDEARLSQITSNLLTNAAKFTQRGGIKISCTVVSVAQGQGPVLKISVRDTGIGISSKGAKELRAFKLFNKLRGGEADRLNAGGTGLGLSISNNLAVRLGGTFDFDSVLGEGSNFCFTIQAALPVATKADTQLVQEDRKQLELSVPSLPSCPGVELLLVDDERLILLVTKMMLTRSGVKVTEAVNGAEALMLLRERTFDCILMDCSMPIMDGLESSRQIRALEAASGRRRTPIIAHTANGLSSFEQDCTKAGMDVLLPKPCSQRQLVAEIARLTEQVIDGVDGKKAVRKQGGAKGKETQKAAELQKEQGSGEGRGEATDGDTKIEKELEPVVGGDVVENEDSPLNAVLGSETLGSLAGYRSVVQELKDSLPKTLSSIDEAYRTVDMERLFHETHALKGTSAYAQATELTVAVSALQKKAAPGAYDEIGDVRPFYEAFEKQALRVSRFLERHDFTDDSGTGHTLPWS